MRGVDRFGRAGSDDGGVIARRSACRRGGTLPKSNHLSSKLPRTPSLGVPAAPLAPLGLPRHADRHRTERSILLAVEQEPGGIVGPITRLNVLQVSQSGRRHDRVRDGGDCRGLGLLQSDTHHAWPAAVSALPPVKMYSGYCFDRLDPVSSLKRKQDVM